MFFVLFCPWNSSRSDALRVVLSVQQVCICSSSARIQEVIPGVYCMCVCCSSCSLPFPICLHYILQNTRMRRVVCFVLLCFLFFFLFLFSLFFSVHFFYTSMVWLFVVVLSYLVRHDTWHFACVTLMNCDCLVHSVLVCDHEICYSLG